MKLLHFLTTEEGGFLWFHAFMTILLSLLFVAQGIALPHNTSLFSVLSYYDKAIRTDIIRDAVEVLENNLLVKMLHVLQERRFMLFAQYKDTPGSVCFVL